MSPEIFHELAPIVALGVVAMPVAWVGTTWLRVRHGYPLENSWGKPMLPAATTEDRERIKLIGSENAQLRAELAGIKDRMAVLERLATDSGVRLSDSIEQLRDKRVN